MTAAVALLREALEHYACPPDCAEKRLKDGTCVRLATDGMCGEIARTALSAAPAAPPPEASGWQPLPAPPTARTDVVALGNEVLRLREALKAAVAGTQRAAGLIGRAYPKLAENLYELNAVCRAALPAIAAQPGAAAAGELRLREAIEMALTGGNHLVSLIGDDHPPHTADSEDALTYYRAGNRYDAWRAWRGLMLLSRAWEAHKLASAAPAAPPPDRSIPPVLVAPASPSDATQARGDAAPVAPLEPRLLFESTAPAARKPATPPSAAPQEDR